MTEENRDYSLFLDFFEAFSQAGVEGIASEDPLMIKLEKVLSGNKQILYIGDLVMLDMLFVSKGVYSMFGIEPENIPAGFFITTTIQEDNRRHQLARAKVISEAQKIFAQKSGKTTVSSNFRAKTQDGTVSNLLYQAYLFYSKIPYESVFLMMVLTDISEIGKMLKSFHFYNGDDPEFFRFPDEELLKTGNIFSHTEFNIIGLIDEGLSSTEIAEKLFRSVHTINTHRGNILDKSGKSSISHVIRDLKETGLL